MNKILRFYKGKTYISASSKVFWAAFITGAAANSEARDNLDIEKLKALLFPEKRQKPPIDRCFGIEFHTVIFLPNFELGEPCEKVHADPVECTPPPPPPPEEDPDFNMHYNYKTFYCDNILENKGYDTVKQCTLVDETDS